MKPSFALILSLDGICLLHRASGGWRCLGEVHPESPLLGDQLRYMRRTAMELAGSQFATKLVIPNSQILYTKIDALGATDARRAEVIRQSLDGLTPYGIEDLVFDWCDAGAGIAHVAAVARETLQEAAAFAAEHRLNPVSYVATPEPGTLVHEVYFGQTDFARTFLSENDKVEPDAESIKIIAHAEFAGDLPSEDLPDLVDAPPAETTEIAAADQEAVEAISVDDVAERQALAPDFSESDVAMPDVALPENETHEADEVDAQDIGAKPDRAIPTFSSRRDTDEKINDAEPLRLKFVAPRIAPSLGEEPKFVAASTVPHEGLSVTSPTIGDVDAPRVEYEATNPASRPSRDNPLSWRGGRRMTLDPQVRDQTAAQRKLAAADATAHATFSARRPPPINNRPKHFRYYVAAGVVAGVALVSLISGAFFDGPISSLRSWQSVDDTAEISGDGQTATAVVASAGFSAQEPVTEPTPTPEPDIGIEIASLGAPGISSTELEFPTEEEAAEVETEAPPPELLTPEGAEAAYTASGIWQLAPMPPVDAEIDRIDDLYLTSIDREIVSQDAIALPFHTSFLPDTEMPRFTPPAPAGTQFDLDERGFVKPSLSGTLSPDGVLVFAGKPARPPALRPYSVSPELPPSDLVGSLDSPLAQKRPISRPTDLLLKNEKERLGGRSLAEIGAFRPLARPESAQESHEIAASVSTTEALQSSRQPIERPSQMATAVALALAEAVANPPKEEIVTASASAVTTRAPKIPTKASVAKEATIKNAISLSKINLIGIYGSSSNRRALIRLKSGRYVKVQIGDKLDGGRVAAITSSELKYIKSGKNHTLKMPTG